MRLLILSDAHANIAALKAVAKDAGKVDAIYFAGDAVDYGTDPNEAIDWLREQNAHCVMGNHDRHLLNILDSGEAETFRGTRQYKWVHDNCDRISSKNVAFLRGLPMGLCFTADGVAYLMRHQLVDGSYDMPESLQAFDDDWRVHASEALMSFNQRRMIFGHTHRRCVHQLDNDRLWLNPGSVSYRRPDDRDKRAHYMLIENGNIHFRAVDYDRSAMLARAMAYVRAGTMLETDLQDAMFFFGNALTSREPLPKA
ncbi:MAG: metallophosphoesterase family protein [Eubacteriales bacterium]|nr:metallophosphoesterase family protein [Eubacteriales bacterium]